MKYQTVKLSSHDGVIERVVVKDFGKVVTVTTVEELEKARAEGREPAVAGFKKSDVIDTGKK
jgi:hypothetical protein